MLPFQIELKKSIWFDVVAIFVDVAVRFSFSFRFVFFFPSISLSLYYWFIFLVHWIQHFPIFDVGVVVAILYFQYTNQAHISIIFHCMLSLIFCHRYLLQSNQSMHFVFQSTCQNVKALMRTWHLPFRVHNGLRHVYVCIYDDMDKMN